MLPEAVVAQEQCVADGLYDNNGLLLPDAGVAHEQCAAEGVANVQGLYSALTRSNVWPQTVMMVLPYMIIKYPFHLLHT